MSRSTGGKGLGKICIRLIAEGVLDPTRSQSEGKRHATVDDNQGPQCWNRWSCPEHKLCKLDTNRSKGTRLRSCGTATQTSPNLSHSGHPQGTQSTTPGHPPKNAGIARPWQIGTSKRSLHVHQKVGRERHRRHRRKIDVRSDCNKESVALGRIKTIIQRDRPWTKNTSGYWVGTATWPHDLGDSGNSHT